MHNLDGCILKGDRITLCFQAYTDRTRIDRLVVLHVSFPISIVSRNAVWTSLPLVAYIPMYENVVILACTFMQTPNGFSLWGPVRLITTNPRYLLTANYLALWRGIWYRHGGISENEIKENSLAHHFIWNWNI